MKDREQIFQRVYAKAEERLQRRTMKLDLRSEHGEKLIEQAQHLLLDLETRMKIAEDLKKVGPIINKKILLVQSKQFLESARAYYGNNLPKQILRENTVPEDLSNILRENNFDGAIIHVSFNAQARDQINEIAKASQDGHKILLLLSTIRYRIPEFGEDLRTLAEEQDIPYLQMRGRGFVQEALNEFAGLFEQEEPKD